MAVERTANPGPAAVSGVAGKFRSHARGSSNVEDAVLAALSLSSKRALDVANSFRAELDRSKIHMEHLLVGLFENVNGPTRIAFAKAGIDADRFTALLWENHYDAPAPGRFEAGWPIVDDPWRFSSHTAMAIRAAADFAHDAKSPEIRTRHLLQALFTVPCEVLKPFQAVAEQIPVVLAQFAEQEPEPQVRVGRGSAAGNDRVAREDQLGFDHYVQAFADLIESPQTQPPLTIGIFGSWGMGKSFLLKHIARELQRREKRLGATPRNGPVIHVVRFNAWEYNATERIWPGLVRKVMDEVDGRLTWWNFPSLWVQRIDRRYWQNFIRTSRANWGHLLVLAGVVAVVVYLLDPNWKQIPLLKHLQGESDFKLAAAAVGALAALLKLLVDTFLSPLGNWVAAMSAPRDRYGAPIDYMREIREDLRLLDVRLRNGAPLDDSDDDNFKNDTQRKAAARRAEARKTRLGRVLIVIDDLDRCEPDKAVEVLQAINLLLNFDSFIVCMGIDARVITGAVEKHYKDLLGPAGISGYEYLDKIIQIPFRIPEPNKKDLEGFVEKQLGRAGTSSPSRPAVAPQPGSALADATSPDEPPSATDDDEALAEIPRSTSLPSWVDGAVAGFNALLFPKSLRERNGGTRTVMVSAPVAALRFSDTEVEAFRAMTPFLKPNPRHVKRMINVYLLVRSLREHQWPDDPLPAGALVRWLVTCGQWPYTCHRILERFDEIERDRVRDAKARRLYERFRDDPLRKIRDHLATKLNDARVKKLDDEPEVLDRLLRVEEGRLSWNDLQTLRQYTINFNPAVESEIAPAEPPMTPDPTAAASRVSDASDAPQALPPNLAPSAPARGRS
ncbi:MAG TPA: P-loop NTPase fold protein [Longimicrobium sp.]|nr:P-loop NTPase fold protein [Longimicrobium sp.]